MNKKLFLFVLLPVLLAACQGGSSLQVDKPTVESRQNPDGIGTTQPRFSWQLASPLNDVMQAAYQIEVAASETGLKHGRDLLWNTGRVESDQDERAVRLQDVRGTCPSHRESGRPSSGYVRYPKEKR